MNFPSIPVKPRTTPIMMTDRIDFFATMAATPVYPKVNLSNMRLNASKKRCSHPVDFFFGFKRIALNAGLSVKALKAENNTEIAMVMANVIDPPTIPASSG